MIKWPRIPRHILRNMHIATGRLWKAHKRRQVRYALQIVRSLNLGSAFMPEGSMANIETARRGLEELQRLCRADRWGR